MPDLPPPPHRRRIAAALDPWHPADNIWPEVCAGLRAAGVSQLTIFNAPGTNTLVMHITTAGNIDLGAATG